MSQILTLVFPPYYPLMILKRERGSSGAILFALLFVAQWLLYATSIANLWLGVVCANMAMLALLYGVPHWGMDLEGSFSKESRDMFESGFSKIFFLSVLFYSIPPMIADSTVTFVTVFFVSEAMSSTQEIAENYLQWTSWHLAFSWVLLAGWLLHIFRYDLKLHFQKFLTGVNFNDGKAYSFNAVTEFYLFAIPCAIAVYATVKMIEYGFGFFC